MEDPYFDSIKVAKAISNIYSFCDKNSMQVIILIKNPYIALTSSWNRLLYGEFLGAQRDFAIAISLWALINSP